MNPYRTGKYQLRLRLPGGGDNRLLYCPLWRRLHSRGAIHFRTHDPQHHHRELHVCSRFIDDSGGRHGSSTNQDAFHTVNSESVQEPFDSPLLTSGASFSHTFTVSGTHAYDCDLHPSMPGATVTVLQANVGCEDCVCEYDAACCSTLWDGDCVDFSATVCASSCGCDGGSPAQSCCDQGEGKGCSSEPCMECICASEPSCCTEAWTPECALLAAGDCNGSCSECGSASACCEAHFGGGCGNQDCTDCVCATDASCCQTAWDDDCVAVATACGANCGCQPADGCSLTLNPREPPTACATTASVRSCLNAAVITGVQSAWKRPKRTAITCECGTVVESCGPLLDCALVCGLTDNACIDACKYQGTPEDRESLEDVLSCGNDSNCTGAADEDLRLQTNCGAVYSVCKSVEGSSCCEANPSQDAGCPLPICQDCVCNIDSFCCGVSWDSQCADLAATTCKSICGCVADIPLEECAEVFGCILECPGSDNGTRQDACLANGVGAAKTLMEAFGFCGIQNGCFGIGDPAAEIACSEGLCTGSYVDCMSHQVPSIGCDNTTTGLVTDNEKCVQCVLAQDSACADWGASNCSEIAQTSRNTLCNCTSLPETLSCGDLDGCMNACGLTDLLCVADCVSVSTNDALIKHSDLQSCAHTNGCYLPSATIPAQDCINANCATEAGACAAP